MGMPSLKMPLDEAAERLRGQIEKGRDIQAVKIESSRDLEQVKQRHGKWSDYNILLLRKMFSDDSFADRYNSGFSPVLDHYDFMSEAERKAVDFRKGVDTVCDFLKGNLQTMESILGQLPLIPVACRFSPLALVGGAAVLVLLIGGTVWISFTYPLQAALLLGLTLIGGILALAILYPEPPKFLEFVFRVVLSLGFGLVGWMVLGTLELKFQVLGIEVKAVGSAALLALVYLLNPPALVSGHTGKHRSQDTVQ